MLEMERSYLADERQGKAGKELGTRWRGRLWRRWVDRVGGIQGDLSIIEYNRLKRCMMLLARGDDHDDAVYDENIDKDDDDDNDND